MSTATINLVKGTVNLKKGDSPAFFEKTSCITATASWDSETDYDLYALVMLRNGQEIAVAMFGADDVPALQNYGNGKVRHHGDVVGEKRGFFSFLSGKSKAETNTETIDMRLDDEIVAVVPVAYSAQSNGTGSFYRYKVSLSINNGAGTTVEINADNANNNDKVYSCVPGIIYNTPDGVKVEYLEKYSIPNSECRPKLRLHSNNTVEVIMDAGPINDYK